MSKAAVRNWREAWRYRTAAQVLSELRAEARARDELELMLMRDRMYGRNRPKANAKRAA